MVIRCDIFSKVGHVAYIGDVVEVRG